MAATRASLIMLQVRLDPDLLRRLDEFCASREYPTSRTKVLDKWVREQLDVEEAKSRRAKLDKS